MYPSGDSSRSCLICCHSAYSFAFIYTRCLPTCVAASTDVFDSDSRIIIADLPNRSIEKGIAGVGLLSLLLVSKFVDHLPLYRQCQQLKRQDVIIPLSALTDWVRQSAELLTPLYNELKSTLLLASYLQANENPFKVLGSMKQGSTHLGYMWLYHAPQASLVLFDYRQGRDRAGPNEIRQNFSGYLQTDAMPVTTTSPPERR